MTDWERQGFPDLRPVLGLPPLPAPSHATHVLLSQPPVYTAPPQEEIAVAEGVGETERQDLGSGVVSVTGQLTTMLINISSTDSNPSPEDKSAEHLAIDE